MVHLSCIDNLTQVRRAKVGSPPDELVHPRSTPRQQRLEMHEAKLGMSRLGDIKEPNTDDDDEACGIMARADLHLRCKLSLLHSPIGWVRECVVSSLASVHSSSLVAITHAVIRTLDKASTLH